MNEIQETQALIKERFFRPTRKDAYLGLKPFFLDFHRLRMEGDYAYPLHQHTNYEAILVERGPYRCLLNGRHLKLGNEQMLLIKPGDWHQDLLRRGQRHYVLHFSLRSSLPGWGRKAPEIFASGVQVSMQVCRGRFGSEGRFFAELEREAKGRESYAPTIQDALLEALFWRILRALPEAGLSVQFKRMSSDREFLDRMQAILAAHLSENLSVDELASRLAVSRRTLSQKCRELLGDSPAKAFTRAKIEQAQQLLEYTDLPIKEISDRFGFRNPYHFSKVFKRIAGRPPSAVRGKGERKSSTAP